MAPCEVASALEIGAYAAHIKSLGATAVQLSPQINLKPFTKLVTDEQIIAIVNDQKYSTRCEQAARLGITERSLYRRLRKIEEESET